MNLASLRALNRLPPADAQAELLKCCGATGWAAAMAASRPFESPDQLHERADARLDELDSQQWLLAFSCHPKIGDLDSLRMKFAGNKQWSAGEQSALAEADEQTLRTLRAKNDEYLARFGFIFIVCASGKSAAQMLALLERRLANGREAEIVVAAAEQRKITHLRLDKLLENLGQ